MKREYKRNPFAAILFLSYAAIMLSFLYIRNRSGDTVLPYWEQVSQNYNLTLFRTIRNYWDVLTRPEHYTAKWGSISAYHVQFRIAIVNIVGNVVLFIPMGAFFPAMWSKLQKAWKTFSVSLLTLILVEITQLLTLRGSCDVDDLVLNMSGICMGYFLWWVRQKRKK